MGKHHKVTEKSPAYQGFTPSPNTPFDFSRRSVEDAKILQEKTAKKRLIIGGIREGYTRTHPGENGVRIPLFEVAKLLVDHGYIRKSNNTDVLAELCESFPESNVYLGLNSFIVPAVYLWSFQLELPIMAQWLSYTLQDLTDRADSTGLLLERKFTQKRHLAPGETGSRQIDIHMEEYVAILLNQHFIRADP